ncbi:hypothetical protein BTO30_01040 [Domibacillus antri]|uniref:DUF8042 domain-containing protein n=1 Tax=Domibacillus antri TaxID=1714264 RepID=A0A1Q8Q9K9_9BACI|nr:hypothetical protein [Domibacillus antri]OLN24034.1 hypothetical protein BTO30_01040 [Domibacillus antri]
MEFIFQEQVIQFDQDPTVEQIIEQINTWLNNSYYFSHLIVDGVNVYEEPEQYLTENLGSIDKLEIVARTAKEFTNEILLSAENYLQGAIPELTKLSDGFYNNPASDTWDDFGDMLEGMQWLNQIIVSIDQLPKQPQNWDEYLKLAATLEVELKNLEEAMENSDNVLIGDIIQYEMAPLYEAFEKEIQTTIDTEGSRHDVN